MQTTNRGRLAGRFAFYAAIAGTVLGPLHALARFATTDGQGDLASPLVHWWAVPAARTFHWLLRWGSADTVYLTYGKVWLPIALAATVCAFAVQRARAPRGLERAGWWIALTGYVLVCAELVGSYYTPFVDQAFMFIGLPAILVSVIGSTLLGIALLRGGFRPLSTAWLLATWLLSLIVLDSVIALGAALVPMLWAWGLAGRRMSAPVRDAEPVPVG
jgi:hypothetical protein